MRAALLSQQMHHGDGDAAFRLLQRGRALRGIKKLGWRWRLAMANEARRRMVEQRRLQKEERLLREHPELQEQRMRRVKVLETPEGTVWRRYDPKRPLK